MSILILDLILARVTTCGTVMTSPGNRLFGTLLTFPSSIQTLNIQELYSILNLIVDVEPNSSNRPGPIRNRTSTYLI